MKFLFVFFVFFISVTFYGQIDYSLSFDGVDDYVHIPATSSLNFASGDITFECWFKKPLTVHSSQTNLITNYITPTNPLFGLYIGGISEGAYEGFVSLHYRTNQAESETSCESLFRVDDNLWYHVAGVKNVATDSIYLYINGNLANQTHILVGDNDSYQGFVFGGYHLNRYMEVYMDDIRVWSKALSEQEVQQYMSCPPSDDEEGLVGCWNFEEGSGTTVFDQTANGNDGAINGAAWSSDTPEQNCLFCSSSDEITVTINVCGCTDSDAVNYNIDANQDDGSCCYDIDYVNDTYDEGYSEGIDSVICPENNCPADLDENGYISTSDLLLFLIAFGQNCDVLDACGVINGDGSTCAYQCGEPIQYEGYDYSTVQIGEQCWFSENCRYLPVVSPSSEGSNTSPYYYVYDYQGTDIEAAKSSEYYETYGVLYNWPAVMTEGVCPSGWHIPSDGDWQTMEVSLGMSEAEASSTGWRGTDEGYKMKATAGWNIGGNGSNSSEFSALPGGFKYSGGFGNNGSNCNWWSSSEFGSDSWDRTIVFDSNEVNRSANYKIHGFSARCLLD